MQNVRKYTDLYEITEKNSRKFHKLNFEMILGLVWEYIPSTSMYKHSKESIKTSMRSSDFNMISIVPCSVAKSQLIH